MIKRAFLVSAIMFTLAPTAISAAGLGPETLVSPISRRLDAGARQRGLLIQAHSRPVFLGCVYSYHECEHRGHDRGFFNHFTRHDHRACHHGPSYACYGQ